MRDDLDAEDLPWPWSWLVEGFGALVLVAILVVVLFAVQPLHGALTRWLDALSALL